MDRLTFTLIVAQGRARTEVFTMNPDPMKRRRILIEAGNALLDEAAKIPEERAAREIVAPITSPL